MLDLQRPFDVANDLLDDPERLRAAMREDGYLFFRDAAPRDAVLEVRRDVLALCREAGWIEASGDPLEATWSSAGPFTEGEPQYMELYKRVLHLPSFDALPEHPRLVALASRVLGGEVQVHLLRIARIVFPQNVSQTIAPHQDYHYIRGTPETYTLWIPLGDCQAELGGLAVLKGSHKAGFTEHVVIPGKKVAARGLTDEMLPSEGVEWRSNEFRLGDVLMFHSCAVHKALPNLTPRTLRLSTDNRYQRVGDAIAEHSLKRHYGL